jgi:hypothetical protein
MNFIFYYLLLELKLFNRKLLQIGFNLNLFWSIVPAIFILSALHIIQNGENSTWILVAFLTLLFQNKNSTLHQEFLDTNIGKGKIILIRLIRNLLLALPFVISMLYFGKVLHTLALIVIAMIGAYWLTPKLKPMIISTPFRKYPFEFIIGFRRYFWIWLLLIPTIYLSYTYQNDAIAIFVFAVILLVQLQFFSYQEPTWYIWNEAKSPTEFLFFKIKIGMICNFISITIPTLILFIVLPNSFLLIVSIWAFSFVLCAFSILNKYAYIPNQLAALQGFLFTLNLIFPPLLLFSIPYLFKKAEQNLKHFLYDSSSRIE